MSAGMVQRRRFVKGAATMRASAVAMPAARALRPDVADAATATAADAAPASGEQPVQRMQGFALNQVRLLDSDFATAAATNRRYLHSLPVDRLEHSFCLQAYLNEFTFRVNRRFYPFNAFCSLLGILGSVIAPPTVSFTPVNQDPLHHRVCL
jgi:hypothetical protein